MKDMCRVNAIFAEGRYDAASLKAIVRFRTRKEYHEAQRGTRREWTSRNEEKRQTKAFEKLVQERIEKLLA